MSIAYHQPQTLDEALAIRAARPVVVLAGGTDVYPAKATRAGWGDVRHADVLDISRIPGLRGIEAHDDHWRIGALTTWTDILRADLPPLFDGLKLASKEVGGVQIQNRGTLGGNLCNASPAADGVPPLLTLDADIEIASRNRVRREPLQKFIDGYRHATLRPDELVTAILIPRAAGRGHFLKLGARRYLVISIAMVAGVVDIDRDGRIARAAIAVGACSAIATRLPGLEAALIGQTPATARVQAGHLDALTPLGDIRASADYRRAAALALVRDLVAAFAAPERRAA